MLLTLDVPDSIAEQLHLRGPNPERRALELLALHGYTRQELSCGQVGELLGLTFYETEEFLHANGALLPVTADEVYQQAKVLEKLTARDHGSL